MAIIDLIKNYTGDKTTVTAFSVGTFSFDCQLEENHESTLTVTDNAMESGALMSDHSYLEPRRFSVRGVMVSYEPFNIVQDYAPKTYSYISSLPNVGGIVAKTEQAVAVINRYAGKALNALSTIQDIVRPIAPWLPDSLGWLGDESEKIDRVAQAYDDLLSIQKSGELLTVSSGLKTYNNMALIGVVGGKNTDDGAEFTLVFREVHISETRTVQGLVVNLPQRSATTTATTKPDGDKKTGRAADQSAKPKAKGKTQPQKATPKKSALKSLAEMMGG